MMGTVAIVGILAMLWHYERERRQERWRIDNKHEQRMLVDLDATQRDPEVRYKEVTQYSDRW